jgi:hypothetical protein
MPNTEGAMLPRRCRADTLIDPSLSDNIEITSNPYAPVVSVGKAASRYFGLRKLTWVSAALIFFGVSLYLTTSMLQGWYAGPYIVDTHPTAIRQLWGGRQDLALRYGSGFVFLGMFLFLVRVFFSFISVHLKTNAPSVNDGPPER